jgi:hypothetical protein
MLARLALLALLAGGADRVQLYHLAANRGGPRRGRIVEHGAVHLVGVGPQGAVARDPRRHCRIGPHRPFDLAALLAVQLAARIRHQHIIGKFHDPVLTRSDAAGATKAAGLQAGPIAHLIIPPSPHGAGKSRLLCGARAHAILPGQHGQRRRNEVRK